jgi:hypothetical protein
VQIVPTRAVSLATLIRGLPVADLIDMDVQGAEADMFEVALALIRDRV